MKSNRGGANGPIMVARIKVPEYCSLRAEEIEGIIEHFEQEIRRKPSDFEQTLTDLEKCIWQGGGAGSSGTSRS
jgi:hypothetical protein